MQKGSHRSHGFERKISAPRKSYLSMKYGLEGYRGHKNHEDYFSSTVGERRDEVTRDVSGIPRDGTFIILLILWAFQWFSCLFVTMFM